MSLSKEEQTAKIQAILGKGKPTYTYEEKVRAIKNWYDFEGEDLDFNMDMVDSCEQIFAQEVDITDGQKKGLDKIISGFGIKVKDHL